MLIKNSSIFYYNGSLEELTYYFFVAERSTLIKHNKNIKNENKFNYSSGPAKINVSGWDKKIKIEISTKKNTPYRDLNHSYLVKNFIKCAKIGWNIKNPKLIKIISQNPPITVLEINYNLDILNFFFEFIIHFEYPTMKQKIKNNDNLIKLIKEELKN